MTSDSKDEREREGGSKRKRAADRESTVVINELVICLSLLWPQSVVKYNAFANIQIKDAGVLAVKYLQTAKQFLLASFILY